MNEKNMSCFFCKCRSGFSTMHDNRQRFWVLLQKGQDKSSVKLVFCYDFR